MIKYNERPRTFTLRLLSSTAIVLTSMAATSAFAQSGAPAAPASVDEVVVTGSRIVRDGYTAPTPVTVATTEQLQRTAPGSIPEGLNQLPQFSGSRSNQTVGGTATNPSTGNYLNLRNLGAIRTLILLDGQRLPPTSYEGTTDANIIPSSLVQRVEVVTGGASAAYGSDAVSGVINFILDTKFNGFKSQVQWGQTKYKDAPTMKANFAGGFSILDGKVHILASFDHYQQKGIPQVTDRKYGGLNLIRTGTGSAANPYIDLADVRYSTATYGTLISYGSGVNAGNPLAGFQFVSGGLAVPFNKGIATGTSGFSVGGDGVISFGKTLTGTQKTDQFFGRADFDVAENVTGFAQVSYSDSFNSAVTIGSGTQVGDFRIFTENAFIADSTRAILQNAGVVNFTAGRIQADQPFKLARFYSKALTFVSGVKGSVGDYNWDLGYSHGSSDLDAYHEGNFDNARWYAALDAVKAPSGQIVCRITLTNPTLQPGCVPINIFGNGSPSKAAYDYISQTSNYRVKQDMDIFTGNMSGEVFNLPAGAISVAVGAEYRRQKLKQTSNTDPSKSIDLTGLRTNISTFVLQFNSTNIGKTDASQNVKEIYAEAAIPLLKDVALVQTLDLNAAARYTDYSTSGGVSTWKVGLSYVPTDSVRIRGTRSRDIRAPTLNELFQGATSGSGTFNDIHTGVNARLSTVTQGNVDLTPEIADTMTVGLVFSPTFAPRLQASVDYYKIKINDAIGTLGADQIQAQCEASNGTADVCKSYERPLPFSNRTPANFPTLGRTFPFNQASVEISGLDYEISYRASLGFGMMSDAASLDLRLVGGRLFDYLTTSQAGGVAIQSSNSGNNIKNRVNLAANYRDGPLTLSSQIRYLDKHHKSQDPTVFYVDNNVKAITYTDVTASYKFDVGAAALEGYVTIANLFNTQPPLYSTGGQPTINYPTNTTLYDVFGRFYTVGLRAKF